MPGEVIGERFRLEALAGTGGMGAVYRATDLETNAPVAVKLLHDHAYSEAARFAREAEALALLSHPHIVRYIAHGILARGLPYLAMEWLEGEDLHSRLRRGPLPMAEALTLVAAVAQALSAAHARGLVHRDIKPSNLFLVDGRVDAVKVVDFGIVRWHSRAITRAGMAFGTPGFIAPEQAAGSSATDARADVFSLGCVLFEALTGRRAFDGDNPMAVLAKLTLQEAPSLSDYMPDAPVPLIQLLARMMAKAPAGRPSDGAVVAAEIAALDLRDRPPFGALRARSHAITDDEQRIVSLVMAHHRSDEPGATLEAIRALVWPHARRVEVLLGGTVLVVPDTAGTPTEYAVRAASCALSIQARLPGWSVAIVTGSGELAARRVVGEVIDRATRMLDDSHAIRLDDDTAALLDTQFQVSRTDAGPRLVGSKPLDDEPRTVLGKRTPCLGRDADLRALAGLFEDAVAAGRSRAVLVTGPPGIGKTRLKNELVGGIRASRPAVKVWSARGDPVSAGSPYGMIAALLRRAVGLPEGIPRDLARERLRARVALGVPEADRPRVAAFLGEILGAPSADADAALQAARQNPALMGDQMERAVSDLIAAECARRPLLLVLEDLHWGDLPSVRVIDAALRASRDRPLVVLALARPEVADIYPKLWHGRGCVELALAELPRKAAHQLVQAVLGDSLPPDEAVRLVEISGGNPFYLEELIRAASAGRGQATAPPTVLGMVQARLEDLAPDRRRWLRAASVYGVTFWGSGVDALLGEDATERSALLAELADRELIRRHHESRFAGELEYSFQHALVREAAHAMLTEADRPLAHRLAAEWLHDRGEHDLVVLAEHFEAGHALARAAEHYQRAAVQAQWGRDLDAVLALTARATACGASGEVLVRVRLLEAVIHQYRVDFPKALDSAEAALALAPEGTALWFETVNVLASPLGGAGRTERLLELARRLENDVPTDAAARVHWAKSCAQIGIHLSFAGRIEEARRMRALLDAHAGPVLDNGAVRARSLEFHAHLEHHAGNVAAYPMFMPSVVEAFERVGDSRQALMHTLNQAWGYADLGAHEEVEQAARRAQESAEAWGATFTGNAAAYCLGRALLHLGRPGEALEQLAAAIAGFREGGHARLEAVAEMALADLHLGQGDLEAAGRSAARAVERLAESPSYLAPALATRARIRLAQGRASDAERDIADAMAQLRREPAVDHPERIRLVHAEVLHAAGDLEGARASIAEARKALLAQALAIPDARWRACFLERVPDNVQTLALARAWLGE